MGYRDIVEYIRAHEKELVVFNAPEESSLERQLAEYFETQNVRIAAEKTAAGGPEVAVLSTDGSVLTVVSLSMLEELLTDVPTRSDDFGFADKRYADVLTHLKETTFTSTEPRQLLYASREIEDRARRVGAGTIHAGFQRFSTMAPQKAIYSDLASRGVTVHAYGVPDVPAPNLGDGQVHPIDSRELARAWFVVFDGGGETHQKSALLAYEQAEREFYGAWSYDPGIVDRVLDYLEQRRTALSRTGK